MTIQEVKQKIEDLSENIEMMAMCYGSDYSRICCGDIKELEHLEELLEELESEYQCNKNSN